MFEALYSAYVAALYGNACSENLPLDAYNETAPKGRCAKKPCVTGALAKRKSTIVSDTLVSKLSCLFGGAEGNRTPVRKQLGKNFTGRSLLFTFPHPGGNKHPTGISSFMIHGARKA